MINRDYGLTHHNLAQVVIDHNNNDNNAIDDIEVPTECNSCNSQSNIPHAIHITR